MTRQVPLTEKQPVSTLMPFAKVEVAPVTLSAVAWMPAPKVEVALPRSVVVAAPFDMERTELDALVKEARPVNHEAPETESRELDALMKLVLPVKEFTPEKVLLLVRSVEDAAVMV